MRGKFIGGGERGLCITPLHPVIFNTASQRERGHSCPPLYLRGFAAI